MVASFIASPRDAQGHIKQLPFNEGGMARRIAQT
jgi:hypothetical protein